MPSPAPSVAIVIPTHTPDLSPLEETSWRHLTRFLEAYPLHWVVPDDLSMERHLRRAPDSRVHRFHPDHFSSVRAYCRLLTTEGFYRAFADYEYILIHQLDTLVFSDSLAAWCARGDAYTGAPWVTVVNGARRWVTGNGGFSLRRVDSALRVLTSRRFSRTLPAGLRRHLAHHDMKYGLLPRAWLRRMVPLSERIDATPGRWLGADTERVRRHVFWNVQGGVRAFLATHSHHEDIFWSQVAPIFDPAFRVTPAEIAVRFAFELEPRWCFEKTGGQTPFGCHAWARHDRAFWEPFLLR